MLTKEAIVEFQELYRKEFGKEISLEDAEKYGIALIRLYKAVYSIRPKKEQQ